MCGLVGATSRQHNVMPMLVESLRRLEYRGYDSTGVAAFAVDGSLYLRRALGSVSNLAELLAKAPFASGAGIAHTRWATHGVPSVRNAHPQVSGGSVAVVHNGIIENYSELRRLLEAQGYRFSSDTDTEVIAHSVHAQLRAGMPLLQAVRAACRQLRGSYALAVISTTEPGHIVAARLSSPLVVGVGDRGCFVASDLVALQPTAHTVMRLEDGDIASLDCDGVQVIDASGQVVERTPIHFENRPDTIEKHGYRHFMLKEIFEQGRALRETLAAGEAAFGGRDAAPITGLLQRARHVHLVACGTSYHACLVASYLIESLAGVPCTAERASEYRYRRPAQRRDSLFIALSQSGETADTLAALRFAKAAGYLATMAICNVSTSSMVREADHALLTHAGAEIGVASTKAFTTQLMIIAQLALALARAHGAPQGEAQVEGGAELARACVLVELVLELNPAIKAMAAELAHCEHVLFVARGTMYPIAMEGALKLKEISYIHADAYAAGELKHGPLALVDDHMPVVALAPGGPLHAKLRSNLEEIRARGGRIYVFADSEAEFDPHARTTIIRMPSTRTLSAPLVYTIPLQLLAYEVALLRGSNVDQPRNLAKSVTVE
ncbi:MAG TPA: glutamine--fructose-6-phosphate transaminase (isomerizing) [Nevskiaceae bacterium]|nr:glutamine--fructose-6-phosphate transaminase (isomerizing) [Nevskiaceae bacterium]